MTVTGIKGLEADVKRSMQALGGLPENWVPARPGVDHDVLIVGGGQSGVTAAFALARTGISRFSVIESADEAATGAWRSKARMRVLRTAKRNTGPDLGIPALAFRAWYEAQHGAAAYEAIGRVATTDWIDYLAWVRAQTGVPVRFGTRLVRIEPEPAHDRLRVHLDVNGVARVETVRKVVLATGAVGGGVPNIPEVIRTGLPADRYAHSDAAIDFAALKGRDVAVLGGGSSAFDAAAVALEAGAATVRLLVRADDLVRASPGKQAVYPGVANNFFDLPDEKRWRLARFLRARSPGPMTETVLRATAFSNFHIHLATEVKAAAVENGRIALRLDDELRHVDFVILGTGYTIDPALRPELADVADEIATWGDRPATAGAPRTPALRYPYLGDGYQFTERHPGAAPWLADIHCFNYSAITSYGRHVGDVSSLATGIPRLVAAVSRDLFLADFDAHHERITGASGVELTGEEYAHAVWRG
ncbi:FAD-dependent urate hydroxylase HpyO [soil metagenome]